MLVGTLQVFTVCSQTVRQISNTQQAFETKVARAMSEFTGQLEGLQIAMKSMELANTTVTQADMANVLGVLKVHDVMLRQCLKFCMGTLEETTEGAGTHVKYAVAVGKAMVFVGNMGVDENLTKNAPSVVVNYMRAEDFGRAAAGNMGVEVSKAFFSRATNEQ
jgi:hypothetical protein